MSGLGEAKKYARIKIIVLLADFVLTLAFFLAVQFGGLSEYMKDAAFGFSDNYYLALLAYIFLFSLGLYLFLLPLGAYSGFYVEHKFNLSNQGPGRWAAEEAKKALLSFAVFTVLMELLYATVRAMPGIWWVAASLGWIGFSVLLARLFPVVIIPLFYRYRKISDEGLRKRILDLTGRAGVKVTDVFEIDFSKNTKKANAALVGWGSSRRIILADNLVKEFSPEEIEVVVAHEMAHYKLKHIWKLLFAGCAATFLLFYILDAASGRVAAYFGADGIHDMAIFPAMAFIFYALSMVLLPAQNAYSRKLEADADRYALKITKARQAFISLMEKLAAKNLADKEPNRITEFLLYDHPPISRRIELALKGGVQLDTKGR